MKQVGGVFPAQEVGVQRRVGVLKPVAIKQAQHGLVASLELLQVGIKAIQQEGTEARLRFAGPEITNEGFLENVVAAQHFIGPFAGYHYLYLLFPHFARKAEHRNRSGSQDGTFGVPNDFRKELADVAAATGESLVPGVEEGGDFLLVGGLIKFLVLKTNGKGLQVVGCKLLNERRGGTGDRKSTRLNSSHVRISY